MAVNIIITIILLFYGYLNMFFENKLASPFLALVFIYMVWKLYGISKKLKEEERKIDEIKTFLEKNLNKDTEDKDNS